MQELEFLRNEFSDAAKLFPGMSCAVLGWHKDIKQPRTTSESTNEHGRLVLPVEYLYSEDTVICTWDHVPGNVDIPDELLQSAGDLEIELLQEEGNWYYSWNKKTWLMRPEWQNWSKTSALHRLTVLVNNTIKYLSHESYPSALRGDFLVECDIFSEEFYVHPEYPFLIVNFDIIKWLWYLFLNNKSQSLGFCSGRGHGFTFLSNMSALRKRWLNYFTKNEDVFLESAILCGNLVELMRDRESNGVCRIGDGARGRVEPSRGVATVEEKPAEIEQKAGADANKQSETATLVMFMQQYCDHEGCDVESKRNLLYKHNTKKIRLPKTSSGWKSGQAKIFYVKDLLQRWPSYRKILPTLPPLKKL